MPSAFIASQAAVAPVARRPWVSFTGAQTLGPLSSPRTKCARCYRGPLATGPNSDSSYDITTINIKHITTRSKTNMGWPIPWGGDAAQALVTHDGPFVHRRRIEPKASTSPTI